VTEKGLQVAATMYDAKHKHVLVFDTVNEDILPHSHAAASGAEIVIAGTSDIGKPASMKKRLVRVSIKRLAFSMLPLSLAT